MIRTCVILTCVALLGCAPASVSDEEGGVTTDPSGSGGVTSVGEETSDWEPPDPGTTSDPDPDPILDWGNETGDPGLIPGQTCTSDRECASGNCYVIPFLGGSCGECNEDADCPDGGCSPPNPFNADNGGSVCNMGEFGAGCETDEVCHDGLSCATTFDLLGLIYLNSCSTCLADADCQPEELCAAQVELSEFSGAKSCILPGSIGQNGYCDLATNGDQTCESGICSVVDIMGLAEIGACGDCNTNADCDGGTCLPGELMLNDGALTGSVCQ